jgi:hypothetical protein
MKNSHWLFILFYIVFCWNELFAQPKEMSNLEFYNKFILLNDDRVSVVENIKKLRIKLTDTLFLEEKRMDTTWLKKHRQALYLNFLCYEYEASLSGGNKSCCQQIGFENYKRFYFYKDLKGFPDKNEYENRYLEAKYRLTEFCIKIFIQNKTELERIPETACACKQVIQELKKGEDDRLLAAEMARKKAIEQEIKSHQKRINDSIAQLNKQIKYEPIYYSNGILRADSLFRLTSKNTDSLNSFLVQEMLRSSSKLFSFYVNNCANNNIEKMLDIFLMQKNEAVYWKIKLKKVNGNFILLDEILLNEASSGMRLKLISELFLSPISPYVNENESLILPFKVSINKTYSDNRTVEYRIENGYVNIVLPIIIDPKELIPYIHPDERIQNEEDHK